MNFDFIIASERSGSNLLVKILNSHSQMCGPTPSHLIRTFLKNRHRYKSLKNDSNWDILITDVVDFLNSQLGKWGTNWKYETLKRCVKERTLSSVIRTIYESEAKFHGKKRVIIKENNTALLTPFLLPTFPKSRYLHLVRDPRDMALSWKLSNNHPGGVKRASAIWNENQFNTAFVRGALFDTSEFLSIRYEDLISSPRKTIYQVCNFLKIPFEFEMMHFYNDDLTQMNAQRINDWKNLAKPIISNNSNKYKQHLSVDEIKWIEYVCGSEMKDYGYDFEYEKSDTYCLIEKNINHLEKKINEEKKSNIPNSSELMVRESRQRVIEKIINRSILLF